MSLSQASGIVQSRRVNEKRNNLLERFPKKTRELWLEFVKLSQYKKIPKETDWGINIISLVIYMYLFFKKDKRKKFSSIRRSAVDCEIKQYTRFRELSETSEIKSVLDLFEKNSVPWSD